MGNYCCYSTDNKTLGEEESFQQKMAHDTKGGIDKIVKKKLSQYQAYKESLAKNEGGSYKQFANPEEIELLNQLNQLWELKQKVIGNSLQNSLLQIGEDLMAETLSSRTSNHCGQKVTSISLKSKGSKSQNKQYYEEMQQRVILKSAKDSMNHKKSQQRRERKAKSKMGKAFSDVQSEIGSVGGASINTQTKLHHIKSIRQFKEDQAFDEMSLDGEDTRDRYDFYDATGETAAGTSKNQQNFQSFSSFSEQNLVTSATFCNPNRTEEKQISKPKLSSKQIMHLYRNQPYKNYASMERPGKVPTQETIQEVEEYQEKQKLYQTPRDKSMKKSVNFNLNTNEFNIA